MKVYTVTQRPPSTRVFRGKMLCIGDTVHHMLPTHAQGACSALEDAAALEILFSASNFPISPSSADFLSTLKKRLQTYTSLRLPRSATTQILSSTNPRMTMAGIEAKVSQVRKFYGGELVDFPLGVHSWSAPIREFWYGYDAHGESEKAIRAEKEGKTMEEVGVRWFGDLQGVRGGDEGAGLV
jgi:salicylate hydroxylase